MWEVSGLFENIGTVQDGIGSISLPGWSRTSRTRQTRRRHGRDPLRGDPLPLRQGSRGVLDDLSLTIRPGEEGRHRRLTVRARSRVDAGQSPAALLRPGAAHHMIDGQDIAAVAQDSLRRDQRGDLEHLAAAPLGARQRITLRPADAGERRWSRAARRAGARLHSTMTPKPHETSTRMSATQREACRAAKAAHRHRSRNVEGRADPHP